MRRAMIPMVVLLMVAAWVLPRSLVRAGGDPEGCDGLSKYRGQVLTSGELYLNNLANAGIPTSRGALTYSSDDWKSYAKEARALRKRLGKIKPPGYAKRWHELEMQRLDLQGQLGDAAASSGIMAVTGIINQMETTDAALDQAVKTASAVCSAFADFQHDWDALDGDVQGTPVATPVI